MDTSYDFCGWATRNDILCSDGKVIRKDAFVKQSGSKVPLVWSHQHDDPSNVLGHAFLENRPEGVYAYCSFNDSERARDAKTQVEHGDITAMSIFANQLKKTGPNDRDVVHGTIREVSLVLAGANPGAYIESVIKHGEFSDEEAVIYTGEELSLNTLTHADEGKPAAQGEKTVQDVIDTFNEEQKTVFYYALGKALEDEAPDDNDDPEGGDNNMKHNVFDQDDMQEDTLMHDAMNTIIGDAKRFGSMKESFLQHAETYGINNLEYLFPDEANVTNMPTFIQRDTGWVKNIMGSVHHSPFSRIKSIFADITEDDARAKGYMKGKLKKEEVFSLLKRATTPTTIYKKQKMDRNDVIDITNFDVVTWLKAEMRGMLDEEIARAVLVGDGRLASSDDKIDETNIRPIWTDADLYTIKAPFTVTTGATSDDKAKAFIRAAIKSRKDYKGSGNPVLYTTEDVLTDCLLLTDEMGRDLYDSAEKLATKLRVSSIVTVPVMENLSRTDTSSNQYDLWAIIVNPNDYNIGADKGGAINMFDDFDIDYNQQKYLIETRCSGALIKPYSAIAVELKTAVGG